MAIRIKYGRMLCGREKENWTKVWFAPIPLPDDLTTPDLAPEIGLFSRSRGEVKESDPMYGQVAWEPFFSPEHFPSNSKAERSVLQKKILCDAWRYLIAKDPRQIEVIRIQLSQGSQKQRMLLKELEKARKARSSAIRQSKKRKAKKSLSKNPNRPAKSIEKPDGSDGNSDSDSGLGLDTDEDDSDDDESDDDDARQMPPPSRTVPRRHLASRHEPSAEPGYSMSGGRGSFNAAESNSAPARASSSATTQSHKRKNQTEPGSQRNSRARREERGLFVTPPRTGQQHPRYSYELLDEEDLNGGLNEDEAFELATRLSEAPGQDSNSHSQNAGSTFGEGFHRTIRESMPPEGGVDE